VIETEGTSNLTNSRQAKACHPLSKRDHKNQNYYYNPKGNWTPFYITIYNTNTKKGSMAVEMYLASKPYNLHHPDKVCHDLNISRKTYYTYLKDLISKGIVRKHKLTYKINHYTNDYRLVLWSDYESVMESRYESKNMNWKEMKEKRKQKQKPVAKTRIWYQSPMARIMKDYGINYIKAFDNYNPNDAYLIVQELEQQYRCSGGALNAAIIVRAILDAWNWTKIQDRIHAKRKRLEAKENSRRIDSRYYMEYV
jgi:predicted transcriptional regulator